MAWGAILVVLLIIAGLLDNQVLLSRLAGRCQFVYPQSWGVTPCRCKPGAHDVLECRGGTLWFIGDKREPWGAMLPGGQRVCTAGPFVVRRGQKEWVLADSLEVWVFPAPRQRPRAGLLVGLLDALTGTAKPCSRTGEVSEAEVR